MKKATSRQTRAHNRRLILKTIYEQSKISRADIARATSLTRTTVSEIAGNLIKDGLIEETGRGPSEGGKPPVLLSIVDDSRFVIGVDLANSEFLGAVINLRGDILYRHRVPVDDQNGTQALANVYKLIDNLLNQTGEKVAGIGIGTPGLINAQEGLVRQAVNLDWQDLPLRKLLRAKYNKPVHIANDSHAAAHGEYTFGHNRQVSNLIVVKVGRGVSAGIVLNGRLHYGDGSGAGEIGHIKVVENGVLCRCGKKGCLETVTSTQAIIRQIKAIHYKNDNTANKKTQEITSETVLAAYKAGDENITRLVDQAGYYLGIVVANLVCAMNIQHIIIAGSLARVGEPLINTITKVMQEHAMVTLAQETEIELSRLGQDIVLLGAASLVLSNELGFF